MSDLTDTTGSGVTDTPTETAPPIFDNQQIDAILGLVAPLLEAAVATAVAEAAASTPVPVFRPGTCRAVDASTRTCQVLVDGDDETLPSVTAIAANILGENPIVNGRVMVLFSPPSSVHAISMVPSLPAGMVLSYAGVVTADVMTSSTQTLPPPGFLRCYAQVVFIADYAALYDAIGTTFNSGGETAGLQFRLPDMRGRAIFGLDNMGGVDAGRLSTANTIGTTFGAETHTIASGNMPAHTHDLSNHTHSTPSHSHGAGTYAVGSHTHDLASHTHDLSNHTHTGTSSSDGAHQHDSNMERGTVGVSYGLADSGTGGGAGSNGTWNVASNGAHTHSTTTGGPSNNTSSGPSNNTSGGASPGVTGSSANDGGGTSGGPSVNATGSAGSGSSLNHMPPGITLHYVIKF